MTKVRILIEGDPDTGAVHIEGAIDAPILFHWLLGEAHRVCVRRANKAADAKANGDGPVTKIAIVGALPPGALPQPPGGR